MFRKSSSLISILIVPLFLAVFSISLASTPKNDKGLAKNVSGVLVTAAIENEYIKTLAADNGQFVTGTTGGDPSTPSDDNRRLLYGYPSDAWTSFSTLRISEGNDIADYRLGIDIVPTSPVSSDGTRILSVWELDGIRVEQRLYFTQNPATGRPDTTAIEYILRNDNTSNRTVGLRMMLDVMVGGNDGAPYFIEGAGQVTHQSEWNGAIVPNYWLASESATFNPASLKGRGQLSGDTVTRPDRFVVADWEQAFNTVWNYAVNPSDPVTNDSAVILYYSPVTLGPNQTRTLRTYYGIAPAGQTAQVELTGLEVTQGIQNWMNNVVLLEARPTFVRAHVRSTSGTVQDVTAELVGRRNGNPLPGSPLQASNVGGNIDVREFPNRQQLNQSFYFELPSSWRSGDVEFEFRGVSEPIQCRESAGNNNDCKAQVTFVESPEVDMRLVGIIWREGGVTHQPNWADIYEVVQQIESTFPVPRANWDRPYDIEPVFFAGAPRTTLHFRRLNTMLATNRLLDGCVSTWPVNCARYYLGVIVDEPSARDLNGMAVGIPGNVATAYLLSGFTHPHELGHIAGRRHVKCTGDEAGVNNSYPYTGGKISPVESGDNAFFGFDINAKSIYGPNSGDIMSYCRPRWTSDYTYTNIRNEMVSRFGSALAYDPSLLAITQGQVAVLVSGYVSLVDSSGELGTTYTIDSPVTVGLPNPGAFAIRFENSSGQELATYSFSPDIPSEGSTAPFALLLPRSSNTARIVLLHNNQSLDVRIVSDSSPTVTVLYPNGGEHLSGDSVTLSWSASDPDGDMLEFAVQHSTDAGTTWDTLVSNWPLTSYELNLGNIAGTSQGMLRVLATDGFNTASDMSNSVFSVAKKPPQVDIRQPETNALYVGSQTVILEGSAYDAEDGLLSDVALSWHSSLDGFLGNGTSLALDASTLTEGSHRVTLTALDSDGQNNSVAIVIQIYRNRPFLPASLAVSPEEVSFVATVGNEQQTAWQILSIHNDGDGSMNWQASFDQSWLRVSSFGGVAPTDILIAADPTGLPIGEYTGRVTITAPGASNSPHVVEVVFYVVQPTRKLYLPMTMR